MWMHNSFSNIYTSNYFSMWTLLSNFPKIQYSSKRLPNILIRYPVQSSSFQENE